MDTDTIKAVLTTIALVLAANQLFLIAVGYGKLRLPGLSAAVASRTHRRFGDVIIVLVLVTGAMCAIVYGIDEDDMVTHGVAGAVLAGVFAVKVGIVRLGGPGWAFPLLGLTLATLLAVTWATSDDDGSGRGRGRGGDRQDEDGGGRGRGRGRGGDDRQGFVMPATYTDRYVYFGDARTHLPRSRRA